MTPALRRQAHALSDALRNLAAQPVASLFSVVVLALALALPVVAAVALRSLAAATAGLDTEPHINVYLALDASDEDARAAGQALRALPGVASVKFVPRAEALAELKSTTHLAEILATLDRNPLPHAFTLRLRPDAADATASLRAAIAKLPKVDQVSADFEWSRRLGRWVRFGERAVLLLGAMLALAVGFIVGHLIRLQVVTRREEIEVSQLVGATSADVRRPFLYHGILQGILSGGLAVGLAAALAAWVGGELSVLTPEYATELKVVFLAPMESGLVVLAAAVLGLAGAWIAVSRELRRFSSP